MTAQRNVRNLFVPAYHCVYTCNQTKAYSRFKGRRMLRNQRRVQYARKFGSRNRYKFFLHFFYVQMCRYSIGLIYNNISPTVIPLAGSLSISAVTSLSSPYLFHILSSLRRCNAFIDQPFAFTGPTQLTNTSQ
ncbi:hypothetical protein GYMLUDRAFT_50619 [Collybiopsis luxurians FD-317 M1]|uniref:Uncharacterized protein n=1 Tax=Collybiopsis luxurians FD-317 M1 TaxID=944289 RepID=A0A0D0C930_9AGAR|nr:hypothetical protein GYMLUDRAFT_50619 [Collybiopsis luxurians FD-317 M1]